MIFNCNIKVIFACCRLLTALWTSPDSDVSRSSTTVSNDPGYPVSSGVSSAVAAVQSVTASMPNAKFFTPYKKLPPCNLDKTAGKGASAIAVLDMSAPLNDQRYRKLGQQCSVAAKFDLTIPKERGSDVTNTVGKLPVCSNSSGAGTCADADKKRLDRTVVDDGALHSDISGSQQKLVSVCEKIGELRNLAREEQLARVASKNRNQNVRPCPGQLWLARRKGSNVTRIPIGSAVSGKRPASYSKQQVRRLNKLQFLTLCIERR